MRYGLAYYNRARLCVEEDEYAKAIPDYTKTLELNPGYFEAYYGRGYSYFMAEQYDAAILDFDKAIAIDPKDDWSYLWRGNAHRRKGMQTQNKSEKLLAIADWGTFVRLAPDDY